MGDRETRREAFVLGKYPQIMFAQDNDELMCVADSYNHYVELVEPADNRACIKCCDDSADCPLNKGKLGVCFRKLL